MAAEAVENAVKLARTATKKPNIIVFQGSFHGRTIGTMSWTTSKTIYRAGFGPLPGGCTVVPFPYAAHLPVKDPEQLSTWCLEQVELALKQRTAPSETATGRIQRGVLRAKKEQRVWQVPQMGQCQLPEKN